MNKLLVIVMTIVLAMFATSSFADTASGATGDMAFTTTGAELHGHDTTATKTTALIGKCSTGVGVGWITSVNGYAVITQHKNGSKAYATSFDSTSIFAEDVATVGTVLDAAPATADTADFTSWNEL